MAGKIFINYRRGDDPGFTQALYLRLEDDFASDDLFMDVEGHIKPGDDFVEVLNTKVAAADVLLVVIGPRWVDLLAARQGDPDDFVAIEITAALDQGKRVIPVLVGGAAMPRRDTLPASIRPLARRNAVTLRPERFKADCQGLVVALKEQLAAAEQERAALTETARRAGGGTGNAKGARCPEEHNIRSLEAGASTTITFVNNSAGMIRTYWIDYQGSRKFYAEVAPGHSYVQQTYLTHPWVVTNSDDDCLGVYMPSSSPRRIVIGAR